MKSASYIQSNKAYLEIDEVFITFFFILHG